MRIPVLRAVPVMLALVALLSGFTFADAPVTVKADGARVFLQHGAELTLEEVPGVQKVPQEWVAEALESHSYPRAINRLLGEDYPIYMTDMRISFEGEPAAAVTGSSRFMLIGARAELNRAEVARTVMHELGHALFMRTLTPDRWQEYLRIRNLDETFSDDGPWHKQPRELFADDFAYLFGSGTATRPMWRFEDNEPQHVPGLRAYFLSLVQEPGEEPLDWLSLAFMDADRSLKRAEWVHALGEVVPGDRRRFRLVADFSAIPRWAQYHAATFAAAGLIDLDQGRFQPDRAVTRAEAAADVARLLGLKESGSDTQAEPGRPLTKGKALAILRAVQQQQAFAARRVPGNGAQAAVR